MEETPWEGRYYDEVEKFADQCRKLHKSNPYDLVALDHIMNALMTCLWDKGFSQTEIRTAFDGAISDMPRYAAGEERRGDRR